MSCTIDNRYILKEHKKSKVSDKKKITQFFKIILCWLPNVNFYYKRTTLQLINHGVRVTIPI